MNFEFFSPFHHRYHCSFHNTENTSIPEYLFSLAFSAKVDPDTPGDNTYDTYHTGSLSAVQLSEKNYHVNFYVKLCPISNFTKLPILLRKLNCKMISVAIYQDFIIIHKTLVRIADEEDQTRDFSCGTALHKNIFWSQQNISHC